eukprot:6302501-Prymnesium_polylepis.1
MGPRHVPRAAVVANFDPHRGTLLSQLVCARIVLVQLAGRTLLDHRRDLFDIESFRHLWTPPGSSHARRQLSESCSKGASWAQWQPLPCQRVCTDPLYEQGSPCSFSWRLESLEGRAEGREDSLWQPAEAQHRLRLRAFGAAWRGAHGSAPRRLPLRA